MLCLKECCSRLIALCIMWTMLHIAFHWKSPVEIAHIWTVSHNCQQVVHRLLISIRQLMYLNLQFKFVNCLTLSCSLIAWHCLTLSRRCWMTVGWLAEYHGWLVGPIRTNLAAPFQGKTHISPWLPANCFCTLLRLCALCEQMFCTGLVVGTRPRSCCAFANKSSMPNR